MHDDRTAVLPRIPPLAVEELTPELWEIVTRMVTVNAAFDSK